MLQLSTDAHCSSKVARKLDSQLSLPIHQFKKQPDKRYSTIQPFFKVKNTDKWVTNNLMSQLHTEWMPCLHRICNNSRLRCAILIFSHDPEFIFTTNHQVADTAEWCCHVTAYLGCNILRFYNLNPSVILLQKFVKKEITPNIHTQFKRDSWQNRLKN